MLKITVPATEYFDETKQLFVNIPEETLLLEHSLYTISKWESKWHKAFLSKKEKTAEEVNDYIRCMTMNEKVNPMVYLGLTAENHKQIKDYLEAKMTATCLPEHKEEKKSGDTTTAELIYYWMVSLQIPFECQHWHINRLLTLIQVCNIKNQPPKKRSRRDIMRRNSALNAQRCARHNTRG